MYLRPFITRSAPAAQRGRRSSSAGRATRLRCPSNVVSAPSGVVNQSVSPSPAGGGWASGSG